MDYKELKKQMTDMENLSDEEVTTIAEELQKVEDLMNEYTWALESLVKTFTKIKLKESDGSDLQST